MLYDSTRHESLSSTTWSSDLVRDKANEIFDFLVSGRTESGWPATNSETNETTYDPSVYMGAAGAIWALDRLSKSLGREVPFSLEDQIRSVYKDFLSHQTDVPVPSLFLGESGSLSVYYALAPSDEIREKLVSVIARNAENPVNEALWGCPGTMISAVQIGDASGFQRSAKYLFDQWYQDGDQRWIWMQDLYGSKRPYVGAGHGFFGNIQALLAKLDWLSADQRKKLFERTEDTALRTAIIEGQHANWPIFFDHSSDRKPLMQWCHGAPGIITSLRHFPRDVSPDFEKLLLKAGEFVWAAGPLTKGVGICHGTDGNGIAFLNLFERTQDQIWLDRARAFASHAMNQTNGRFTLWTGDAGLALYLVSCLEGKAGFPILDDFI